MRIRILRNLIFCSFLALIVGLFYAQALKYEEYNKRAEKNRIRVLPLEAPRGKIFDRNSRLLVTSRIAFDVEVLHREIKDKKQIVEFLEKTLGTDSLVLSRKIDKAGKMPFLPVKIAEDVGKEKAIEIEERILSLPGVIVTTRPLRDYLYGETLSHALGYLGRISTEELEKYRTYGYGIRDFMGKDGIEKSYNDYLRGIDGGLQVEVDSRGRQLRILAMKEPEPGRDVYLSVDIELQEFCESLMTDKNGAIIAMVPTTGEVLALVSRPGFDPNIFVEPDKNREVRSILRDSVSFPLLDRAISCAYPPGSVFKVVVAACALDSGRFTDENTLSCDGSLRVGNRIFHCWRERGHGAQKIVGAMENSCNVFFYQLGLMCGADNIASYAFKFGLGQPTGIDLPGESAGVVPTTSWKRKNIKEPWFKGETANYSIGQGYLLVTPIQVARLISVIANGGELVHPFLVTKIEDVTLRQREAESAGIKKEALNTVKEGMKQVVNGPHGTGFYARSKHTVISGKTGTAQNSRGESHAWFAGFAPFEEPGFCIVVFIEHGGKGGLEPAKFAKQIIEKAKKLKII